MSVLLHMSRIFHEVYILSITHGSILEGSVSVCICVYIELIATLNYQLLPAYQVPSWQF